MSEERKMILQMVSDGKITPEEAEKLLQAIDESERTAQKSAAESVEETARSGGQSGRTAFVDLGDTIERAVGQSLRSLDDSLRNLEFSMDRRMNDPARHDLRVKIEEKMRRTAEQAVRQAEEAQRRAERAAERATRRAEEHARRAADRLEERMAHRMERHQHSAHFIKLGVAIDKVTIEQDERLELEAQSGDRLMVDNRVGDITVTYYEGDKFIVDLKKTVWGEDEKDAAERAGVTKAVLVRRGADVALDVQRPSISGVGVLITKDTRVDYTIAAPYGTHLWIRNKVGDLKVAQGAQVTNWDLETKVGDIDLTVAPEAGFRYTLASTAGHVFVPENDLGSLHENREGHIGDGSGNLSARTKTGDVRVHY